MKTILIVEDDEKIRDVQKKYLSNAGYKTLETARGDEAIELIENQRIDALVLDLNLPVLDGLSVCRKVRRTSDIPIIMVTAKESEVDELEGLQSGANDYITKPFSPRVFVARVDLLFSKHDQVLETIIRLGKLSVDEKKRRVLKDDQLVHLTPTQFNILLYMVKNKGIALSREQLLVNGYDQIVPPDITDRSVDSHIKDIRKAIGDSRNPKYLLTVRGHGYRANDEI